MPDPLQVEKPLVLDILDTKTPALSSTDDMPVIETRPDSLPAPKAAPAKEASADKTTSPESATEATDEQPGATEGEAKKPPRGVQKRLDELTRQREDAVRAAESERAEKLRLLALLEDKGKPATEKAAPDVTEDPEPQKPVKGNFTDPEMWDAALLEYSDQKAAWTARREVKAARAEDEKKRLEAEIVDGQRRVQEAYVNRIEKAKAKYDDFTEVALSPDVTVSTLMAEAIRHSEAGPELQYFFGKNPPEAARISQLSPIDQIMEMGKIASTLTAAPAAAPVAAPSPAPTTRAPKPIAPLKSGEAEVAKSPEDESMEEYAARRKKELSADRRPGVRH